MQLEGSPTPWDRGVEGGKDVPRLGSRSHLPGPGNTAGGPNGGRAGAVKGLQPSPKEGRGGGEQYPGFPLQSLPRASLPISTSHPEAHKSSWDTYL